MCSNLSCIVCFCVSRHYRYFHLSSSSLYADAMLVFTASCDAVSPSSPPPPEDFGGAASAAAVAASSSHPATPSTPTQPKFFLNLHSPPLSPSSSSAASRFHLPSPLGDHSSAMSPMGASTPTPMVNQPVALLCHRAILSVRSPFFRSIIKRRLKAKGMERYKKKLSCVCGFVKTRMLNC